MAWSRGVWALGACGALLVSSPRSAHADPDPFALGDGHAGPKVAATTGEVINAYAPLTADAFGGATQLQIGTAIGDPAGFAANDLVLLSVPTGAPTGAPYLATPPSWLGSWDLARVAAVDGSTLTLTTPLPAAAHFPSLIAQVVKIPEHTTVDVPAGTSLAAAPWTGDATSGFAGGILVFFANGAVTVEGKLDVDYAGFRGGPLDPPIPATMSCTGANGSPAMGFARKGEGLVPSAYGPTAGGWSASWNAGGGGNCPGAGGGGGGNGGSGGDGHGPFNPGFGRGGGVTIVGVSNGLALSLGAGGGAGSQSHGVGSRGGAGGGAIFVRSASVSGAGILSANGEPAPDAGVDANGDSDGAGGGGAGGTVLVETRGKLDCGKIEVRGGDGGNASLPPVAASVSPGGGGGGGRAYLQVAGGSCVVDSAGGLGIRAGAVGPSGSAGFVRNGTYCLSTSDCGSRVCAPLDLPGGGFGYGGCVECYGDYGSGLMFACAAERPNCRAGSCVGCNGDFATGTSAACKTFENPTCLGGPDGTCGRCTKDADCAGPGHLAPTCAVAVGLCGVSCSADADCKPTDWCAEGVCRAKAAKGQRVTTVPPFDGTCTPESGERTCLAGGCDATTQTCGRVDGSPCDTSDQCQHACLASHVCGDCRFDADCPLGDLCDVPYDTCLPGCRETNGMSNCPPPATCSVHDGTAGECLGGSDGGSAPSSSSPSGTDAGADDADFVGGGGCASSRHARGPWRDGAAALAFAALVVLRRRRMLRSKEER